MNCSGSPIFYRTTIALGIIAFLLNSAAYQQTLQGEVFRARRMEQAVRTHIRYVQDEETIEMILAGEILTIVGLTITLAGFACIAIAIVRREKGWYLLPLCVLFFSILPLLFA